MTSVPDDQRTPPIWIGDNLRVKLIEAGMNPDWLQLSPPIFTDGKRHIIEYVEARPWKDARGSVASRADTPYGGVGS